MNEKFSNGTKSPKLTKFVSTIPFIIWIYLTWLCLLRNVSNTVNDSIFRKSTPSINTMIWDVWTSLIHVISCYVTVQNMINDLGDWITLHSFPSARICTYFHLQVFIGISLAFVIKLTMDRYRFGKVFRTIEDSLCSTDRDTPFPIGFAHYSCWTLRIHGVAI